MARNRTERDRDAKRSEIVDAARTLFLDHGYDATSIATVAKAAGIAPNTIYWYFDDKDALLVAVLSRLIREAQDEFAASPPTDLSGTLLWLVDAMQRIEALIVTVHARAPLSPTVHAWHERFHETGDAVMLDAIRQHFAARGAQPPADELLEPVPRIWSYAIEGMVAHDLPPDERRALCDVLVRQLDAL